MLWWCAVAAVLAGAAPSGGGSAWRCPAHCSCGGGTRTELTCGDTIYGIRDDGFVEVDCQGGNLSCEAVPELRRVRTLRHLELANCVLGPGAGACVAAAAGGGPGGPPALYTRALGAPLDEPALRGLDNVKQLVMHAASAQQSLPPLSGLPSLTEFRIVEGNLSRLAPPLPPSLQYLEVTASRVHSLERGTFAGLTNLHTLHLYGNNIQNIDYEDLEPLVSLRSLSVSFTPLAGLRVRNLPALEQLSAAHVQLRHIREGDVSDLPRLTTLTIKSDVPLELHPRGLASLPALSSLSLAQCGVTSLPPSLFHNTTSLVNVTLAWNKITHLPDTIFYNMSMLERLDLSQNSLSELSAGTFDSLASLKEILLDHNRIHTLPERLFSPCTSLQMVSLSYNRLESLVADLFPPWLRTLLLSHNMFSWSPPPAGEGEGDGQYRPSPFNELLQLEVLDLSYNNISVLLPDWQQVLIQNLHTLDLSHNSFTHLSKDDTQFLSLNITVDLRYNNISSIEPHFPSYLAFPSAPDAPSQRILLSHNPFICDCFLFPLLDNIHKTVYDIEGAMCSTPAELRGANLSSLPLQVLTCLIPVQPDNCTCLYRPYGTRYECECALIQVASLPDPREDFVPYLSLKLTEKNDWKELPEFVKEFNVSGIGLTDFDYNVSNVEVIDLSHNLFEKIPSELLEGNYSLFLRGNPLACQCWNKQFILELNKNADKIKDYSLVSCSNGNRVGVVDASALCDVYTATVVCSILAIVGVVAAVSITLCVRYKLSIKVYLSTIPGLEFLMEEEEEEGKQYDVFVSFSHEDFSFIRDVLMPVLDKEYKVCVHYREWEVGQTIPLQIHRSVIVSRRTVVVLSKHYIRSRWALAEFREASANGRLVLVLLEDVLTEDLPSDLREYLTSTTYLEVSDSRFWQKLKRALPRRPLKEGGGGGESTPVTSLPSPGKLPPSPSPAPPAIDVVLNKHGQLVNMGYVKDV